MNKKTVIFIIIFALATGAGLFGVFHNADNADRGELESIEWDNSSIRTDDGEVLIEVGDIPTGIEVSENSSFGVGGDIGDVALSPDKQWIALAVSGAVHDSGWLYEIETDEIHPVAFQYGGGVEVIEWSPDSRFTAFNIGTPAPSEYIKVVDRTNIGEFTSETGTQLRLKEEAGLTPPFSYQFVQWREDHTICITLNEAEDCFDMTTYSPPTISENSENEEEITEPPSIELATRTVTFKDGTEAEFKVSENFNLSVATSGLGKARFMTESPDGRIFVPDMVDYELSHEGRILILDDFNEDTHKFEDTTTYMSGLRGPHNVAFYTDNEGNDWIYITLTEHLIRYPYNAGDDSPLVEPEVVYDFPNEISPNATSTVWHITRTVMFENDTMFVSVGSGCNACVEKDEDQRPVILTMTPEGEDVEVYAEGIKNAVGMEWVDGTLYATENGVDHLGDNAPDDLIYKVEKGKHYGWPYCYELDGEVYRDSEIEPENESFSCEEVPLSFAAFEPHSAPLGITYFEDFHPVLNDSFMVAFQGSWDQTIGTGYEVRRVSEDGEHQVFMDGFLDEEGERVGRPVHVLQRDDSSMFITDDFNGRVYYVYVTGNE